MYKKFKVLSVVLTSVLLMTSCASDMKVNELSADSDPQVELAKVDSNIREAKSLQIDVLSPKNFSEAKENRDEAFEGREKNKDQKYVLHKLSLAQAYLNQATTNATISREILEEAIEARKGAISNKAQKNFPKEFDKADKNLMQTTAKIEKNNTADAKEEKDKLRDEYKKLELDSMKVERLGFAKTTIEKAEKEGAEKFTPKTYSWAKKQYEDNEKIIEKDRYNEAAVMKASLDTTAAANRLLKMVREAKLSDQLNPEQLAARTVKNEQEALLSEKELSQANVDLTDYQNQLVSSSEANENLVSQLSMDKKYEAARAEFTEEEAEIFKQGHSIIMRMKGLAFPQNKATLDNKGQQLLSRVQRVIQDTKPAQIKIEGHTDSLGSKELNQALSTQRAEIVQSYLVFNNTNLASNVKATGFGDQKPISSNKTAEGRTQNRRVDIILESLSQ